MGVVRSQILTRRESLVLYNTLNTLCQYRIQLENRSLCLPVNLSLGLTVTFRDRCSHVALSTLLKMLISNPRHKQGILWFHRLNSSWQVILLPWGGGGGLTGVSPSGAEDSRKSWNSRSFLVQEEFKIPARIPGWWRRSVCDLHFLQCSTAKTPRKMK
jgi:hypothetical protein